MRRRVLASLTNSGALLPYDAEVSWIGGGNDGSFIDTGCAIESSSTFEIKTKISFDVVKSTSDGWMYCYFGAGHLGESPGVALSSRNGLISFQNGSIFIYGPAAVVDQFYDLDLIRGKITVDGIDYSGVGSSVYSSSSVCLFKANAETGYKSLPIGSKVVEFQISIGGIVKVDLMPVRITNENGVSEGAMYDRVSGELFRNAGTGAFVIGPDKLGTELAGGGYKCVRRSWRSASRRSRHFSRWEVVA